jgi:hypothetical protein
MKRVPWPHILLQAGIVTLVLIAPAVAQYRSLPSPPMVLPAPMPPPPPPASMAPPRPPPEIGAPVLAVPEGEARRTERVCIEKEMCVDVPVSPQAPPSTSERR